MTMVETSAFGELLKQYRLAARITQEELAERARLSARGISDLERGARSTPRVVTVQLLADALGLTESQRTTFVAAARKTVPPPSPGPDLSSPTRGSAAVYPSSLPVQLTPLVGRVEELATINALLDSGTRLLTLVGPGGVGKTRLALEVATEHAQRSSPEVTQHTVFISLSSLTDHRLVAPALAQVLGLRETTNQPLEERLHEHLHDQHLFLLMDNFEHLTAAAPLLASLLAACPSLVVLVTSRRPVHIRGEREYAVQPLRVPDHLLAPGDPLLIPENLARLGAVDLFVQRAQAVKPEFRLSHENTASVAEICRCLDGLPLALELAAARIKLLPPVALLGRLDRRLALLTGGAQDLPERQHTMRDTIAWSYDLLHSAEQALFRRLAVFVGGCTLPAVEAICQDSGVMNGDALDWLGALVDQSLLVQIEQTDGQPRFIMLQTIREFGLERLQASGEMERIRKQHAAFYLDLVEAAETGLVGTDQTTWLERLEAEHPNLRAALVWTQESGEAELGLRLAASLWRFWFIRGYFSEGRRWLAGPWLENHSGVDNDSSLAPVSPAVRAKAFNAAGALAFYQSDYVRAAAYYQESLALRRQIGERRGIAGSLSNLGLVAKERGDVAQAMALYDESLALYRELNDQKGIALVLNNLGIINGDLGDYARATVLHEESLALKRDLKDLGGIVTSLNNLGAIAIDQALYERATVLHAESLAIARALGYKRSIATALNNMGNVARALGDLTQAALYFRESVALCLELEEKTLLTQGLEGLAGVALDQGRPEWAARLLGAAATQREPDGDGRSLSSIDRARHERDLAATHAALSAAAFAAAWSLGQAVPLQQTVAMVDAAEAMRPVHDRQAEGSALRGEIDLDNTANPPQLPDSS